MVTQTEIDSCGGERTECATLWRYRNESIIIIIRPLCCVSDREIQFTVSARQPWTSDPGSHRYLPPAAWDGAEWEDSAAVCDGGRRREIPTGTWGGTALSHEQWWYIDASCFLTYCFALLRHCWLGIRKSIGPVKNWAMICWHGYLSGVRCEWFAYGPTNVTATPSSLRSLKSRMV